MSLPADEMEKKSLPFLAIPYPLKIIEEVEHFETQELIIKDHKSMTITPQTSYQNFSG